jgi:hypothetical protein
MGQLRGGEGAGQGAARSHSPHRERRSEAWPQTCRLLLRGQHQMFIGRARMHDVRLTGIRDVHGS